MANEKATAKTIDEEGREILDPRKALTEQTLAVDLARVELDQQIATAHKFPRHIDTVIKKIATLACYNKDAAENCIYALPRGGKPILGPSIGFASIVAQSWGNCRTAAAITYVDRKEKAVIAAGRFFDLETNTETIVPVSRRIVDSKGRLYNDDMIQVTGMAAASIGARNAILRGVSRGLWHPIWLDALGIVRGTQVTFAENKAKAIAAMAQFGVKPEQLFMYLGLNGEIELTLQHLPTIRGMYAALRDGSMTTEEMFDPRRMTGKGFDTVDNPLGEAPAEESDADPTAGMGESQTAPQEPAAAPQAASSAAPATTIPPAEQNAPAPAPAAKPQNVVELRPEGGKPKAPATPEEFLDYWEAFCATVTSAASLKDQWGLDRTLRPACKLTPKDLDQAKAMRDAREAELGKGGAA